MATVRMTTELKDRISNAAAGLFTKRVQEAAAVPPLLQDGNRLLDAHLALSGGREAFDYGQRQRWFTEDDDLYLRAVGPHAIGHMFKVTRQQLPPLWTVSYQMGGIILPNEGEYAAEIVSVHAMWKERQRAVAQERDTFLNSVNKLIRRHATLKQALADWPGLWELVPLDVRSRHNEQTERVKREKSEREAHEPIDVSSLTAAVVTAKIVEGVIV